jgi:mRNA interferase MazF
MAAFERFSVWLIPFPFTDQNAGKRRPAVVVSDESSFNAPAGHSVMAMITSSQHQPWPLDVVLSDLKGAGLPAPSRVRMKLFTLDHRLVIRQLGALSKNDQKTLDQSLTQLFGIQP